MRTATTGEATTEYFNRRTARAAALALVGATAASLALALSAAQPARAVVPGVNGKIVFERGQLTRDVYTMNPDGSGVRRLTYGGGLVRNEAAAWQPTPDRKIAYHWVNFTEGSGIFLMERNGRTPHLWIENGSGPAWSPDGGWIVFTSTRDGNDEIYIGQLEDSGVSHRITRDSAHSDHSPAWSPDGTEIAFAKCDPNPIPRSCDVWVRRPDGQFDNLTGDLVGGARSPAWSPDGAKIAFANDPSGMGRSHIWVMNADGTDKHVLVNNVEHDACPAWSPDGDEIAFTRNEQDGSVTVHVVNSDTGIGDDNETRTEGSCPDWAPALVKGPQGPIEQLSLW